MFVIQAAVFLVINIQRLLLGAPVELNVTSSASTTQTNDNEDTTTLPALVGTICTVFATAVGVFTLYMKCRQQDDENGSCCSRLHDVVLCECCSRNNGNKTEFEKVCERIDHAKSQKSDTLRIVLIGKSGSGKSETANTIIGNKGTFNSDIMADSVTQSCESRSSKLFEQHILLTDTPGIFDPKARLADTQKEIANFIAETVPGPHVLLFIIRVGRLTEEDVKSLEAFKEQFGGAVEKHLVIVFTHSNQLKKSNTTEEQFVQSAKKFIPMLHTYPKRYVFLENDNHRPDDTQSQLRKLLRVIQQVRNENDGSCYTNEMYDKMLREIEEKRKLLEEEKKEKKRKKKEAKDLELAKARQEGFDDLIAKSTQQIMQKIIEENKGVQKQHNEVYNTTMKTLLQALVYKLDETVVCGVEIVNKTKYRLCKHEIKLDGGKIFLDPTLREIDENNFCMMVVCKKAYALYGTKGLLTWEIQGKSYKAAIMWSVPFGREANRLAIGFPCYNDTKTQNDMYTNAGGDKHRRQEYKTGESRSSIEMRFDDLKMTGIMTSERRTTIEIELDYKK